MRGEVLPSPLVEPERPSLFAELQRRRVFRALVGYGVAAFAVLQIAEPILHGFHWPDAVLSYIVAALAIGFPIVVSLAWIFDVNAGRVERTGPAPAFRGVRLWALLAGLGVLAAAPGVTWYFFVRTRAAPAAAAQAGAAGPSIAVLPFLNLSSDKEQEYFSDGITEEILNALAQVDGLRVIGRTSSFAMKGRNEDLRSIGTQLGAGNLLEGSVRKSGARVRITAQLIESSGGSHLWSQQFDRELTDVFAVQEEIARAVVAALKLKLLPQAQAAQRTASVEAHDQYLLGRAFFARGSVQGYAQAMRALSRSVELDPAYAPAWAALSGALFWYGDSGGGEEKTDWPKATAAAEKAIELAPGLADGYAARSILRAVVQDWEGTRADLERARALNPGSVEVLVQYGTMLSALGQLPEAIAIFQQATVLDPLSAEGWLGVAIGQLGLGKLDLAEAAAKRVLQVSPEHDRGARTLGFSYLLRHRLDEARAAFHQGHNVLFVRLGDALIEHELGHPAESEAPLDLILRSPRVMSSAYQLAQIYAFRGETDHAFQWLGHAIESHDGGLVQVKFDPILRPLHKDPRFAALLQKMKLPPD